MTGTADARPLDCELMDDGLDNLEPPARPRMVPVFPRGLRFFRSWRTLRWFLFLAAPVFASSIAMYARGHGPVLPLALLAFGIALAAILFVTLCSGMASSNWGTHSRRREPVRFWLEVIIAAAAYLALVCGGYFLPARSDPTDRPDAAGDAQGREE